MLATHVSATEDVQNAVQDDGCHGGLLTGKLTMMTWRFRTSTIYVCEGCRVRSERFINLLELEAYQTCTHVAYHARITAFPPSLFQNLYHSEASDVDQTDHLQQ